MQKKRTIIAVTVLAVLVAATALMWSAFKPKSIEGQKTIQVEVVHLNGEVKEFEIVTQEEFLRGALEQENLVAGDESEYGLYVLTVDGETVDESKQQWWCFTKNGETINTGIDTTPIMDGEHYEITLTEGW